MGRPSSFSQPLADALCTGLAFGESLRTLLDDDEMPSKSTVFRWLKTNDVFRAQYAAARKKQMDEQQRIVRRLEAAMPDLPEDDHAFKRAKKRLQDVKRTAGQLAPKRYR